MNMLLYEECLYIECISFWHMLYKLIESYVKVTILIYIIRVIFTYSLTAIRTRTGQIGGVRHKGR